MMTRACFRDGQYTQDEKLIMSDIIKQLEQAQMKQNLPSFRPGDTVEVKVWVVEGSKRRLQAFEGVVIAIRNRGLNSAFTVRKISNGEWVERIFQTHSPIIDSITVQRCGAVRKAKLYYLRGRSGKAARIKERLAKHAGKRATKKSVSVQEAPAEAQS